MDPKDVAAQYTAAVDSAEQRFNNVAAQRDSVQKQIEAAGDDPVATVGLQKQLDALNKSLESASSEYIQSLRDRAAAVTKAAAAADPTVKAQAKAQSDRDIAAAKLAEFQLQEAVVNSGPAREAASLSVANAKANLAKSEYDLGVSQKADPERLKQLQVATEQAKANVEATKAANAKAAYDLGVQQQADPEKLRQLKAAADAAQAQADVAIKTRDAQIATINAGATSATAIASQQGTKAEVDEATKGDVVAQQGIKTQTDQAKLDQALIELQDAKRKLDQAPTDAQAKRAVELKMAEMEEAFRQLQISNPIAADQARANVESTRAGTRSSDATTKGQDIKNEIADATKGDAIKAEGLKNEVTQQTLDSKKQGDLYGIQDRMKQIHEAIRSGQLDPAMADQYLASSVAGTDIYHAFGDDRTAQENRYGHQLEQRSQDSSLQGQRLNQFGSMANNITSNLISNNANVMPGSAAGAKALQALLSQAMGQVNSFGNAPAVTGLDQAAPAFLKNYASRLGGQQGQQAGPAQGGQPGMSGNPQRAVPLTPAEVAGALAGQRRPDQTEPVLRRPIPSDDNMAVPPMPPGSDNPTQVGPDAYAPNSGSATGKVPPPTTQPPDPYATGEATGSGAAGGHPQTPADIAASQAAEAASGGKLIDGGSGSDSWTPTPEELARVYAAQNGGAGASGDQSQGMPRYVQPRDGADPRVGVRYNSGQTLTPDQMTAADGDSRRYEQINGPAMTPEERQRRLEMVQAGQGTQPMDFSAGASGPGWQPQGQPQAPGSPSMTSTPGAQGGGLNVQSLVDQMAAGMGAMPAAPSFDAGGQAGGPSPNADMPEFLKNYAPGGNPFEQLWRRQFGRLPTENPDFAQAA